jgi:hypothetical protein
VSYCLPPRAIDSPLRHSSDRGSIQIQVIFLSFFRSVSPGHLLVASLYGRGGGPPVSFGSDPSTPRSAASQASSSWPFFLRANRVLVPFRDTFLCSDPRELKPKCVFRRDTSGSPMLRLTCGSVGSSDPKISFSFYLALVDRGAGRRSNEPAPDHGAVHGESARITLLPLPLHVNVLCSYPGLSPRVVPRKREWLPLWSDLILHCLRQGEEAVEFRVETKACQQDALDVGDSTVGCVPFQLWLAVVGIHFRTSCAFCLY